MLAWTSGEDAPLNAVTAPSKCKGEKNTTKKKIYTIKKKKRQS